MRENLSRSLPSLEIKSMDHLAKLLGFKANRILKITTSHDHYCRSFTRNKNGKKRRFDYPVGNLKVLLRRIRDLLQRVELPDYMHGGIKGKSPKTNAAVHIGKAAVLKFDLKSFFPSIRYDRVYRLFCCDLGCAPDVARILTRLVTIKGSVPQGFPTSTAVSNLVAKNMVLRLMKLAEKHSNSFTQFVDDGCFSGAAFIERLRPTIERIITQEGFTASPKPHKRQTLYSSKDEQVVTGIMVNRKLDVPGEYYQGVMEEIHNLSLEHVNSIRGKVDYIRNLNPRKARILDKQLRCSLKWTKERG